MLSIQGYIAKDLKQQGLLPSKFDDLALPNKRNNIGIITDDYDRVVELSGSYNMLNSYHHTSRGNRLHLTEQSLIPLDPMAELEITYKMTINNKQSLYYYDSTFSQYYAFENLVGVVYRAPDYKNRHYGRSMALDCCGVSKSLSTAVPYFRFECKNEIGNQYASSSSEKTSDSFAYIRTEPYELNIRMLKPAGDSPIEAYYASNGSTTWMHALSTNAVLAQEMVTKGATFYVYFDTSYKYSEDNFLYLRDIEVKQNGHYIFQRV